MKRLSKILFLLFLLTSLGALTLFAADAAVGTEEELQAAINAAASNNGGEATVITLTGDIAVSADGTFTVNGKNIIIDGAGYTITRSTVNTAKDYLFEITNGSTVEVFDLTVVNHVYTFRMPNGANSALTLGAGTVIKGENPEGFVDANFGEPILVNNGSGNLLFVQSGATIQKTSVPNARSILIETKGTLHVYGTLIDTTPGPNSNHRAVNATGGTAYFYEGCSITMGNNGGLNDGTALIWSGCSELNIYGGTFTVTNWDADNSPSTLPRGMIALFGGASAVANISGGTFVMGASGKTAVAVAPLITACSVGTVNITGGSFTQNYGSPLFSTFSGTNLSLLNITGGTFLQNGNGNLFELSSTQSPTVTVGGDAVLTNTYNSSSHNNTATGKVFNVLANTTLVIKDSARLKSINSVLYASGCDVNITVQDNAQLWSDHSWGWTLLFYAGKCTVTVKGNAHVRAGNYAADGTPIPPASSSNIESYAIRYFNNTDSTKTMDYFTLNLAENGKLEAQSSCVYVDVDFVTDAAYANVFHLTGGKIISHMHFGLNLKTGTRVKFTALKNVAFDTYNACINAETITFDTSVLVFEGCSLTTHATFNDANSVAAAVRIGFMADSSNSHTPKGLTSVSFLNCQVNAAKYAVSVCKGITTVTSITVKTTGAGDYGFKGELACSAVDGSGKPTAAVTFSLEGTGKVTLTGVAVPNAAGNVITIAGAGTLTLADCTFLQASTAPALINATANATVTVTGGTKLSGNVVSTSGGALVTLNVLDGTMGGDAGGVAFTGSGTTVNIYGGLFKSAASHTLLVDNGASVTVFGGTFLYTGATGSAVQVGNTTNATSATLTVNGGAFRAPNSISPIFVTNTDASVINLVSCTAMGNGTLFTDYGSYANSLNQTGTGAYTAHNALDLKNGATLRLVKGSAGLRFVTNVTKKAYDHYVGIADGGNVTFGTLIFPAKYMQWLDSYTGEYTKDALEGLDLPYLDIPATMAGFLQNEDGSYTMRAAVVNVLEENESMAYAALAYVTYTVNGITVTQYTNHDAVKNERSIYQVARAAANDVSATEQGDYVYEITSNANSAYVGKYSPFTASQRMLIDAWWVWNDTTKAEVQSIDLYLIAGQSNAAGYTTIADDATFQSTHSAKTFPYVYYVGGMPRYTSVNSVIKLGVSTLTFATSMTASKLGQGATPGKEFGAEFGMAEKLSAYYNATTGKKAAIVKYAVGGTSLSDNLNGNNRYGGNWASPSYLATKTAAGWQSGGLYRGFIHQVKSAVEDYRAMGFIVNIKGVFWMQGEADRTVTGINNAVTSSGSYRNMFKYLVEDMRADFYDMTPYNTNTVEVYVGEVAKYFGGNALAENTNFVAMQNTLDEISGLPGIHIIKSGDYKDFRVADKYHWNCASMYAIGHLVGNAMIANSMN